MRFANISIPIPPFLEKIWPSLGVANQTPVLGQQRPLALDPLGVDDFSAIWRRYDLEISEFPVRDHLNKGKKIIEMVEYCPEIATAIDIISGDCFSSDDGDDQGFGIGKTLNDGVTLIDPEIEKILGRLIDEVIGGVTLELAAERMIAYGDAFASLGVDFKAKKITKLLFLPTWEMFRVELNNGHLERFEQRRYLSDENGICFHPIFCVHWRFRRNKLYGRSLFLECISDWENLKQATEDLAFASRSIGVNPNLHIMPDCVDEDYRKDYKKAYEDKKRTGLVTDFYLMYGADIKKLSQVNPDLKVMGDSVLMWRSRIAMRSRVPVWLLGLPSIGAREISGQPALAYARFINRLRMNLTEGIRHICNLELALNGISPERWQYKIVFPKIAVNPYGLSLSIDDESSNQEIEDLDE
jgi:hypothetical protein